MLQNNNTITKQKSKIKTIDFSLSSLLLSIMIIIVMILILVAPVRYAKSVTSGLKLYFTAVLPGLLPFMFLCKILTSTGIIEKLIKPLDKFSNKVFGLNGASLYAFFMGAISGYPLGAKITSDLYNKNLIKNNITQSALFASVCGPEFVIGAVGGLMLKNAKFGVIIYISCLISAILQTFFANLIKKIIFKNKKEESFNQSFCQTNTEKFSLLKCVSDTVNSLLIVGFYIAIFSLVIDLFSDIKIINIISYPLNFIIGKENAIGFISGIFEMTNGANILASNLNNFKISLISFIISFSGTSIIMQSFSFLSNTPINKVKYLIGKLVQATFSFIITYIALLVF